MRKILFISILQLCFILSLNAQIICVPNKVFSYPKLPLGAGLSASFLIRFDVIGRSPENIRVSSLIHDQNLIALFSPSIFDNLRNLFFLRDSTDVSLKMLYEIRHHGQLNTIYSELISDNELHIVSPPAPVPYFGERGAQCTDMFIDTSIVYGSLSFKGGVLGTSDILVKRVFVGEHDSTIIIRNNCPQYENDIYQAADKYLKKDFLKEAPAATQYFIRFKIWHYSPECNCRELL